MTKLYGLQASGQLRTIPGTGNILCGKVFAKHGLAEEHIPVFRTACTSSPDNSPASFKDLADEHLKITVIEFELVQ